MAYAATRPSLAWIVVAHVLGAEAVGALEAIRLGESIGRTTVPVFALTGLVIGCVVALVERIAPRSGWAAPVLAVPTLAISLPMSLTLFNGRYARTLPVADVLPWLLPLAVWLVATVGIAIGRALARDPIGRSIGILAVAGAIGGIVWVERHVLRAGYPQAHLAATLTILVLAGAGLRLVWSPRRFGSPKSGYVTRGFSLPLASAIAAIALGTGAASLLYGLRAPADRQRLAAAGEHSRDLMQQWRRLLDAVGARRP
jgi:hypothetical protein